MKIAIAVLICVAAVQAAPTTEEPSLPCICTMEYMPVCGVDGVTYGNKCGMNCAKVEMAHEGACGQLCPCPRNYEPVCGSDGQNYNNKCLLKCAGAALMHEGHCVTKRDALCICTFIYMPVCGVDGITYGNECNMKCKNVAKASDGMCGAQTGGQTLIPPPS